MSTWKQHQKLREVTRAYQTQDYINSLVLGGAFTF